MEKLSFAVALTERQVTGTLRPDFVRQATGRSGREFAVGHSAAFRVKLPFKCLAREEDDRQFLAGRSSSPALPEAAARSSANNQAPINSRGV